MRTFYYVTGQSRLSTFATSLCQDRRLETRHSETGRLFPREKTHGQNETNSATIIKLTIQTHNKTSPEKSNVQEYISVTENTELDYNKTMKSTKF